MSDVIVSTSESVTDVTTTNDVTSITITDTTVDVAQSTAGFQGAPYAKGEPIYVVVTNKTGSTLVKGAIVYTSGANGTHTQVSLANAASDATSARTLGWVADNIANNADGYVIVEGYLEGINTQGITEGAQLYLSGTTPGGFTQTKPQAPIHMVYVGVAAKASAGNGKVYVKVQNGYELDELHDVKIVSPQNNDLLRYVAGTALWENVASTAVTVGSAVTSGTATYSVTSGTASHASTAGTATYATTAGTAVGLSGTITRSQVSDFSSGTVAYATLAGSVVNAGTATYAETAGTAVYATNAGTSVYATTSGTSVTISGSITKSQVSDFTSGTVAQATNADTATYATTAGTAVGLSGSITRSQVSDFTSGTVAQATNATNADYATTSGTASYATLAGTSVGLTGSITRSQVSDFTSGTVASASTAGTATYATTAGTAVSISGSITRSQVSDYASGTVANISGTVSQAQVTNLTTDLAGKANLTGGNSFTSIQTITASTATQTPLQVVGASGQTSNLQNWSIGTGSPIAGITSAGGIIAYGANLFQSFVTSRIPLSLKGASSQLADLLQLQNSAGTITGGRNTNSQIFTGSTAAIQTTVPSVSTLTGDGTTVTVTTISAHNLAVGDRITISGVTPSGYNGTVIVASTPTVNTFTYANATTGAYSGGGTIGVDSQLSVTARSAITTPVVVKAAASQSANLTTWQNSSGATVARIQATGSMYLAANESFSATFFTDIANTGPYIQTGSSFLRAEARSATNVGLQVRGAASQSANLQEWQDSSGGTAARVNSTGSIITSQGFAVLGGASISGSIATLLQTSNATRIPLVVQGFTSQSANLQEWQTSSGSTAALIASGGAFTTGGTAKLGQVTVLPASTATVGVVVQGLSGQSANLQEWQTSTGSTAALINSAGNIYAPAVSTRNTLAYLGENAGGGFTEYQRGTATVANPGANRARLYFRTGTNANTLKLVVVAGAAGAETTILDNIPT